MQFHKLEGAHIKRKMFKLCMQHTRILQCSFGGNHKNSDYGQDVEFMLQKALLCGRFIVFLTLIHKLWSIHKLGYTYFDSAPFLKIFLEGSLRRLEVKRIKKRNIHLDIHMYVHVYTPSFILRILLPGPNGFKGAHR